MNKNLYPLHDKLLQMMKEFHLFCDQYNLNYYLIDGSMLGAVRHKGFIPWDDDIDIGMMRKDYEKLLTIKNCLKYELQEYKVDRNFKYGYIKIYDSSTTLVESVGRNEIVGGVFLDIFPIDYVGDNMNRAIRKMKIVQILKRILAANVSQSSNKNFLYNILSKILSIIPTYSIISIIYGIFKKNINKNSKYVCNIFGGYGQKAIVESKLFDSRKLYQFENSHFYSIENTDIYLKAIYNDYNTLPPEEKRKHHNFSYVNTKLPYRLYAKNLKNKKDEGKDNV